MTILKSSADYDKVYYVVYNDKIHQCKFLGTRSGMRGRALYMLNIAGVGIVNMPCKEGHNLYPDWWNTSRHPSILAESVENLRKGRFIEDYFGSTNNAYNYGFLKDFLPNYDICGCGGGIYFWHWNGYKAERYKVTGDYEWFIDQLGFHCILNREDVVDGRYSTSKECEEANTPEVVTF